MDRQVDNGQTSRTIATPFTIDEVIESCALCQSRAFRTLDAASQVVECIFCGYRFVSRRPSEKQIAAAYSDPNFYDGWLKADIGREWMWWKRLAIVRQFAQGPRLLDVGAGIGTFLALARDRAGFQVVGTEVSESARQLAEERYGISLVLGRAEELFPTENQYDVITLWHVLEHVPNPTKLLHACHRALGDSGSIIVAVPNDDETVYLPGRVKRQIATMLGRQTKPGSRYYPLQPGLELHLSHFTTSVLCRMLEATDFQVLKVTVDDHYPEPTWWTDLRVRIARLVLRISGLNFGEATLVVARKRQESRSVMAEKPLGVE